MPFYLPTNAGVQIKILSILKVVSFESLAGNDFLNGVRKRRLIAKETSIANCEVLDEKHRSLYKEFFVGIIIKAGGASFEVTDLLFVFAFCKKINQENWCPRSLAVCSLFISINKFSEPSF